MRNGKKQQTLFGFLSSATKDDRPTCRVDHGDDDHERTIPSKTAATSAGSSKAKRKQFQQKWLTEFSWLRCDADDSMTMFCDICRSSRKPAADSKSPFISGCMNYQRSALIRHQDTKDHLAACENLKLKRYMTAAKTVVIKKCLPLLEAQLKTSLWMAAENIANRKFVSLIDLQISNGCSRLTSSSASASTVTSGSQHGRHEGIYTGHRAPGDMQKALADSIKEMSWARIRGSPYIGIMVDESLDIATTKKLVIFAKIIHAGQVKIEYCANVEIPDGKADTVYNAIVNWLASVGVHIKHVSGFGSDGASVMTGRLSGVGVKLQSDNPRIIHIWCAAHRLALVSYWASKRVKYFARMQEILIAIYNFFEYSALHYNKIRELKKIMGEKVKKFKKPTQVRWLSLQHSVDAVHDSWSALILCLDHEAARDKGEGGAKAKGILKEIKTFKFISTLCLLKDILDILCRVSRVFQKDVIDVDQVHSMVHSTKATISSFERIDPPNVEELIEMVDEAGEYQGMQVTYSLRHRMEFVNIKRSFVQNIVREFTERFPENDLNVLKDLNQVLNPKLLTAGVNGMIEYGKDALERIVRKYEGDVIVRERAIGHYLHFKFFLNDKRHLSVSDLCMLVSESYKDEFPDFYVMASIFLTVPMTSVPCERGFSLQNRHIDKATNRRNVASVCNRMTIAYYRNRDDFDTDAVVQRASQKFL